MTAYMVQYLLLDAELRAKITDNEDVFECPVLFGCLCGRAGVYKKCGI